jgi:hypothetical protein
MFVKTALAAALLQTTKFVLAQESSGFVPLASQSFTYTALPYRADPNGGERGTQTGYNICNSTTQGQESLCQTAIINSLDDFCLWGPPEPNSVIGNVEGEAVAWCTKAGHGTRVIPAGALTGVQFIKTPDYVQVTGRIVQNLINIAANDDGGEMDPHGADQRGNPLGGLLFSNAFSGSSGGTNYVQAIEWHNFMGGGVFCLKACDPTRPDARRYCEHIYDRIGCAYNAPAAYVDQVFESCQGESQDFPGIYTGANGQVTTYQQPAESLGAITLVPYSARIPASSSCVAAVSSVIYQGAPAATGVSSSSTRTSTGATSTRATGTGGTTSRAATTSASTNAAVAGASAGTGLVAAALGVLAAALL